MCSFLWTCLLSKSAHSLDRHPLWLCGLFTLCQQKSRMTFSQRTVLKLWRLQLRLSSLHSVNVSLLCPRLLSYLGGRISTGSNVEVKLTVLIPDPQRFFPAAERGGSTCGCNVYSVSGKIK